jgi:hypothetical protein
VGLDDAADSWHGINGSNVEFLERRFIWVLNGLYHSQHLHPLYLSLFGVKW